ncbi:MAG: (2Fe-2S)-binding protein [Beijerinckiaceae bacterium]|jgi:predicted molibdopterin-dependent oxidoreductase YjgC|nr:(2Fe-2S)-binding protein [Beijerinckiaceae bacterium]
MGGSGQARFVRLGETGRARIAVTVDGETIEALEGDSLLVAILTARGRLRRSEFGPEARSGFCLMAACQDCWVWTADGHRLRACDTPVRAGLSLVTEQPDMSWPIRA